MMPRPCAPVKRAAAQGQTELKLSGNGNASRSTNGAVIHLPRYTISMQSP